MFVLIIPHSKSKNYSLVKKTALDLGGKVVGDKIHVFANDELNIYDKFFPLLKLNVTNWKGVTATFNGVKVNPYRFMLKKKLQVRDTINEFKNLLNEVESPSNTYTYYKREGNRFFFKNDDFSFDTVLKEKKLYYFLENYNLGDELIFNLNDLPLNN